MAATTAARGLPIFALVLLPDRHEVGVGTDRRGVHEHHAVHLAEVDLCHGARTDGVDRRPQGEHAEILGEVVERPRGEDGEGDACVHRRRRGALHGAVPARDRQDTARGGRLVDGRAVVTRARPAELDDPHPRQRAPHVREDLPRPPGSGARVDHEGDALAVGVRVAGANGQMVLDRIDPRRRDEAGREPRDRLAEGEARRHVAGVVRAGRDAGESDEAGQRTKRHRQGGPLRGDARGERHGAGRMATRKRCRRRDAVRESLRRHLRDGWTGAAMQPLGDLVRDEARDRDRDEPARGTAACARTARQCEEAGDADPQHRLVGRARERRHRGIQQGARRVRDGFEHGDVERVDLASYPAPAPCRTAIDGSDGGGSGARRHTLSLLRPCREGQPRVSASRRRCRST